MISLLEVVFRGLGQGSIYALIALGFVIIYKSSRVISFAQPGFMIAGVVLVTYLVQIPWLGFFAAVVVAALLTAGFALGVERTVIRPMIGRPVFAIAIITIALDIVIRTVAHAGIGINVRHVGDPWGLTNTSLGPLTVQQRHLAAVITAAVLVTALFLFFRYTRIGLAMRAVAEDQEVALAQGVGVGMVFALSWAMAGGLAAVAGAFAAAGRSVDPQFWLIALTALPVIILGGLDSLVGAVVAGLAIGVVQALAAAYPAYVAFLGSNASLIVPWLVMLLVLVVRPYGLFGTREVERV
ncbi:branched-chain amino acid ABC transporter permease [Natronosporangium hydrolyticum]|uniref:Branched-chain amino acid ABC transporter permease n=1 Tax=Natronosporangium hydrolyticum TaxID=2811111 RepID=A0A895YIW0_9ACTN|nr:branched-chain amino acid ABC transporter permease [Natronosporangium hydrolyticum]QSB13708.1 branched-chain amino acid ABC transporter permease [Natronosporangium hydrolyticum]